MAIVWNHTSELLRDPNLLVPGQRPIGKVRLNKLHGLAPDKICIVPSPCNRADLIYGAMPELSGEAFISHRGLETPGAGRDDKCVYRFEFRCEDQHATIMWGALDTASTDSNSRHWTFIPKGLAWDQNENKASRRTADNMTMAKYRDQGNVNEIHTPSHWVDGIHHVHTMRIWYAQISPIKYHQTNFVDGEDLHDGVGYQVDAYPVMEGVYLRSSLKDNSSPVGYSTFFYMWDRTLSHEEINYIRKDPYQFLVSA